MTPRRVLLSSTALLSGLFPVALLSPEAALAACTTAGRTTTCTSAAPNPWTTRIGAGNVAAEDDRTVIVEGGAVVDPGDANAVSLRDRAWVLVETGGTVQNVARTNPGLYQTGANTIEFRRDGVLTVQEGGAVLSLGPQQNAEPVNFQGTGNTILNSGTIRATSTTAIWSQNLTGLNTIVNTETGVIEAPGTVIGTSGNGALDFTNRGTVIGNVRLAGGEDTLRFYTGSTIVGDFSGGGGEDRLFLSGAETSTLPGDFVGFETLTKDGAGTWTLSGAVAGVRSATVAEGTLVLTGDNAGFTGLVDVDPEGTLEARAQSLPPSVTNDGLVRFAQPDDGTYAGLIEGSGAVEKTGAGVLTLAPAAGNSYTGGTRINGGTVAVAADGALGAASGSLGFDGGALRLDAGFDLAPTRAVTLEAGGGTLDTNGFDTRLAQAVGGPGALTKAGAGTLTLASGGDFAGGATVAGGTLALPDGAALSGTGRVAVLAGATLGGRGSVAGDVANDGLLAVADALDGGAGGSFRIGGTLTNRGRAAVGGAAVGNRLVVGSIAGDGGVVALNTFLGADGSPSDQLVIDGGSATGTTVLEVTNVGGPGAQSVADGIRVVNGIDSATTDMDAFVLAGDYVTPDGRQAVVAGSYAYTLVRSGLDDANDVDWYLRTDAVPETPDPEPLPGPPGTDPDPDTDTDNGTDPEPAPGTDGPGTDGPGTDGPGTGPGTDPQPAPGPAPLYQPGVPVYESLPQLLLQMTRMPTLQQRVGNRFWTGQSAGGDPDVETGRPVWARFAGSTGSVDPDTSTSDASRDTHGFELQLGTDVVAREGDDGTVLVAGASLSYVEASADVTSPYGDGDISSTGYGVNGALTLYAPNGVYVDGQARYAWYDSDLGSDTAGLDLASGVDGTGYALSVEAGRRIERSERYTFTPQAQLVWSSVDFDGFTDAFDARVSPDDGDSLLGRLGVTWDDAVAWDAADGTRRSHLYAIANLYYEFLDGTEVRVAGADGTGALGFASADDRLWGGLGVGGTVNWRDDRLSLYGETSVNSSLENVGDSYSLDATIGLRVTW